MADGIAPRGDVMPFERFCGADLPYIILIVDAAIAVAGAALVMVAIVGAHPVFIKRVTL